MPRMSLNEIENLVLQGQPTLWVALGRQQNTRLMVEVRGNVAFAFSAPGSRDGIVRHIPPEHMQMESPHHLVIIMNGIGGIVGFYCPSCQRKDTPIPYRTARYLAGL